MDAKSLISAGAVYVAIYYWLARRLVSQLSTFDPEYFKHLGARGGVGPSNSFAMLGLLFDGEVPKNFWPAQFKLRLAIVRGMLVVYPCVLIALFMLL